MKTVYDLYHWSHPDAAAEVAYGYHTFQLAARACASDAPDSPWIMLPGRDAGRAAWLLNPTPDGRQREWGIFERQQPETDAERVRAALELLADVGQTDGDHHKAWVIDQTVRILTGDDYDGWVARYQEGENGPETYAWDEGIAP